MLAPNFSTVSTLGPNLDKPLVEDLTSSLVEDFVAEQVNVFTFQKSENSTSGTSHLQNPSTVHASNTVPQGTAGHDNLVGNGQDNKINGRNGNDKIRGMGGDDTLIGGRGDDVLDGGNGDDTLTGGKGDDKLYGAGGNNDLKGQGGKNIFYISDSGYAKTDFNVNKDKLVFLPPNVNNVPEGDPVGSSIIPQSNGFIYNDQNGILSSDPDGPGGTSPFAIAKLPAGLDSFDINFFIYAPPTARSSTSTTQGIDDFLNPQPAASPFLQVFIGRPSTPSAITS